MHKSANEQIFGNFLCKENFKTLPCIIYAILGMISKCDAIQQKVQEVGKLVFPNAVEIGRGDRKEH